MLKMCIRDKSVNWRSFQETRGLGLDLIGGFSSGEATFLGAGLVAVLSPFIALEIPKVSDLASVFLGVRFFSMSTSISASIL